MISKKKIIGVLIFIFIIILVLILLYNSYKNTYPQINIDERLSPILLQIDFKLFCEQFECEKKYNSITINNLTNLLDINFISDNDINNGTKSDINFYNFFTVILKLNNFNNINIFPFYLIKMDNNIGFVVNQLYFISFIFFILNVCVSHFRFAVLYRIILIIHLSFFLICGALSSFPFVKIGLFFIFILHVIYSIINGWLFISLPNNMNEKNNTKIISSSSSTMTAITSSTSNNNNNSVNNSDSINTSSNNSPNNSPNKSLTNSSTNSSNYLSPINSSSIDSLSNNILNTISPSSSISHISSPSSKIANPNNSGKSSIPVNSSLMNSVL